MIHRVVAIIGMLLLLVGESAFAQRFASAPYGTPAGKSPTADLLRNVGIEQHLGEASLWTPCFATKQGGR